jgi:hypothetical protein
MKHGPALLEFLRNLTPQILLFSVALVLASRLNLWSFDPTWQGVKNVLPLLAVLATFLLAFFANMIVFLERTFSTSEKFEIEAQREARKRAGFLKFLRTLVVLVWKHDRPLLFRTVLAFVVVESGFIAVVSSAVPAATSLLRSGSAV